MPKNIFSLLLLFAAGNLQASERVLLARFELTAVAGEYPMDYRPPKRVIEFFHSPPPSSGTPGFLQPEFVDVVRTEGDKVATTRLNNIIQQRVLEAFEAAQLPDIDYEKYLADLKSQPLQARRGFVSGGAMGGAREVDVTLQTAQRRAHFRQYNLEYLFYGHPDAKPADQLYRLIEACSVAVGAENIFF